MALSLDSSARRTGRRGPRSALRLAPLALLCALAAGCGGGGDSGASESVSTSTSTLPSTAVAGESYSALVSKPIAADVATPAVVGPPATVVPIVSGKVQYGVPVAAPGGVGTSLRGAVLFPQQDAWNRDVSAAAADAASAALIAAIGPQSTLRLGFGMLAGVPYAVADASQAKVAVRVAGDTTVRLWPIPATLEASADPTQRLSVIDRDTGLLHELRGATRAADGSWDATALAAWRLDVADAAPADASGAIDADGGMPVLAGLVRADEASGGTIRHALRVTVPALRGAWLAPARTVAATAGAPDDAGLPPMGLRLRLKAGVQLPADASPQARAIVAALKTYGAIVAGVGPALTLEGVPDPSWDASTLAAELARVRAVDFEALETSGLTLR